MARTPSNMPELGNSAPPFRLPDTDGKIVSLGDAKGAKGYLVMFICNHCPYVIHIRSSLAAITTEFEKKGIAVFGINSNDPVKSPDDSPEKMKIEKREHKYTFPYLFDETQEVARAYDAACTPDFYLYDADRKLVYRGQYDDSRPGNGVPVTGKDLRLALEAVAAGKPVNQDQRPSLGCNIKWK